MESTSSLLERLHLKLVVADTEQQLQRFTDNHLVQIIQLAASNLDVVKQVTEILTFYNRRIKNEDGIIFPVKELIQLVGGGIYQTNLSSIYLRTAFERLSSQAIIEILPSIFERFIEKGENKAACNDIFLLLIPGLISVAKLPVDQWPKLPDLTPVASRLSSYFKMILLFENDKNSMDELEMTVRSMTESNYPGLSYDDCNYLKTRLLHHYSSLVDIKDAIVHLLDYDFLAEKTAFPILVVASAAQLNTVADGANLALKKVDVRACVDDPEVVERLMTIYLGSAAEKEKNIPQAAKVPHCSSAIKTKILPFLTRSSIAPTTFMNNVKICLDIENDIGNTKKTLALLQFIIAVTEKMPPAGLNAFANTFFIKMLKVIEMGSFENAQCAALAYRCLAVLGKAKPELVLTRIDLIDQLFKCIAGNAEDVTTAVMECLSNWHSAFSTCQDQFLLDRLKTIVKANIAHENNRTRLSAIKYADALLRTGDMEIRWLLIRGAGDKRDDVRREGGRLLEASFKLPTPPVEEIINYIYNVTIAKDRKETVEEMVSLTAEAFEMSTKFIWAACAVKVGETNNLFFMDDDEHFYTVSPLIADLLKSLPEETREKATRIALHAATYSQDLFLLRIATCFAIVYPVLDMPTCSTACAQTARGSSRFEILEAASRLSVITASTKENTRLLDKYLADLDTNPMPGTPWLSGSTAVFSDFNEKPAIYEKLYKRLLTLTNSGYDSTSSMLESVFGVLGMLLKNGHNVCPLKKEMVIEFIDVAEKVATSRKDIITLRARHAAVHCIGLFDSKNDNEILEKMKKALYAVGEGPPQPALQLAVGSSLWTTCLGPYAPDRREAYLVTEASIRMEKETEWCLGNITEVLKTLLIEKVISKNHHLRRAAVVWLMIFVQKASVTCPEAIKASITDIQGAFTEALTENDDFTQDIAGKGMSLVYQLASEEEKKQLIGDLMMTLGEGRTSRVKMTGDTVVFEENMLGKAPDGSNLTTYKELCNLATDLNQPDLLYKFMQLAKHNATWNSKKGAAFGFGQILEQARDDLQPYFGQLIPKLYRYRYDPNLKVQQSMKGIWSTITSGKRNVVEQYADDIAREILPLLTDNVWRVRESSCLALADLLHSNDTPYMHSRLPEIFETIMRVRDDIKESVRVAAERTADSIRKLVVRLATTSNKQKSEEFLTTFLPLLIEKGVHSTVKTTHQYSLVLLMELSKSAGKQLRPFLPVLIPCLLDAISDNESAILNYIAVRSSVNQLEALDDLRSQFAGSSPMMSAISDLLPYNDSTTLQAMQPRISEQLRSSVGVSTRAAAAQFITQLSLRAPQLLIDNKVICDKFFAALVPGVSDRNPSVRKNSANALSYLAKFTSPGPIDKLMSQINKYLVGESEDMKRASLYVLKNFSAHCSDIIQGHGTRILPYVFLETCREVVKGDDASKKRHEEWNELWEELVPSTSSALVLYRKEVVGVAVDVLQNNTVWTVKAQAGRMLARVAETLGSSLSGADADEILTSLLPLLSGRTWDGKEKILLAVTAIFKASGIQLKERRGDEKIADIAEILKREAGKKNKDYVSYALAACAAFAENIGSSEMAQWIENKTTILVEKTLNSKDDASSSDDEDLTNLEKEARAVKYLTTNLVAFTTSIGAYKEGKTAEPAVKKLAGFLTNSNLYWKARQDVLIELLEVITRWQLLTPLPVDSLITALLSIAEEMCDHQRRSIAAQSLQIVMRLAERRKDFAMNWEKIAEEVSKSRAVKETGLGDRLDTALHPMEVDE